MRWFLAALRSFSPLTAEERMSWDEGQFGAIAPWWCDGRVSRKDIHYPCGPVWVEPEVVVTYRQTVETPEECEAVCPNCGGYDVTETDPKDVVVKFKAVHRRTLKRSATWLNAKGA